MRVGRKEPRPIVVAVSTPPPIHGVTVANALLLDALACARVSFVHVDTSDHRPLSNVGRLDVRNIVVAMRVAGLFLLTLLHRRPSLVYLPIAQNDLGFLRDALVLIMARIAGVKRIVHLHGGHFDVFYARSSTVMRRLIEWSVRGAEAAIVLSPSLRRCFAGLISDKAIHVVPNGVRVDMKREYRNPDACSVLFLSTLSSAKGLFDLIEAIPLVLRRHPRTRFVFAGEWYSDRERHWALSRLRDIGAELSVTWLGPVYSEAKLRLLRTTDVFVLPTKQFEGQPYAILEAMAAGVPTIATSRGAIAETIDDGRTGILVEEADIAGLAGAISTLLDSPSLRHAMGEAAQMAIATNFSLARWEGELVQLVVRTNDD